MSHNVISFKEVICLKEDNSFRKYLLFMLLSAAVICAAILFFHTSKPPERSPAITITADSRNDPEGSQVSSKPQTTSGIKVTSHRKTTTAYTTHTKTTSTTTEFIILDINSASSDELTKLKGIGDVLASEIIAYRENNGGFRNIEEIMNVSGIGEGIFSEIRDHIYVIDPVYDIIEEETAAAEINDNETSTEESLPTLEESAPININSADRDVLMLLPHIDEDIADRIIDFRERTGGFNSEYELLLIDGLSRNDVSEIIPYILIEPVQP